MNNNHHTPAPTDPGPTTHPNKSAGTRKIARLLMWMILREALKWTVDFLGIDLDGFWSPTDDQ